MITNEKTELYRNFKRVNDFRVAQHLFNKNWFMIFEPVEPAHCFIYVAEIEADTHEHAVEKFLKNEKISRSAHP